MEVSFCSLRAKEVVNICDGKRLGNIIDLVFDTKCGLVQGIVVPGDRKYFGLFKGGNDIFIPYQRICKIGKDVILVELSPGATMQALPGGEANPNNQLDYYNPDKK